MKAKIARTTARTSLLALAVAAAPILAASGVELAFAQAQNPPANTGAAPPPAAPAAPAAPATRPAPPSSAQTAPPTQPPNVAATAEVQTDLRASALVGSNIYNMQNETVGEIEDIILDQSYKMKSVIVSVGGFLGIGSRHVAIAPDQITMNRDGARSMRITMNTTREQMKAAPEFNYISGWRDRTDTTSTSSTTTSTRPVTPNPAGGAGTAATGTRATGTTGAAGTTSATGTATGGQAAPVEGSNSFTEAQARERATNAGFAEIGPMQKDERGVWRGRAKKDGRDVNVAVDYQGNVTTQQ